MKASAILKRIMADKGISVKMLSEMTGKKLSTVYNTFYNDEKTQRSGLSFENVVAMADALGCDVVIRDRETGKEY